MSSRPHPKSDWFMIAMNELEAEISERRISERRKHIAQMKAEITAESRLIKSMEMDLENKRYELRMAERLVNKLNQ
jgi:hypothetical protein